MSYILSLILLVLTSFNVGAAEIYKCKISLSNNDSGGFEIVREGYVGIRLDTFFNFPNTDQRILKVERPAWGPTPLIILGDQFAMVNGTLNTGGTFTVAQYSGKFQCENPINPETVYYHFPTGSFAFTGNEFDAPVMGIGNLEEFCYIGDGDQVANALQIKFQWPREQIHSTVSSGIYFYEKDKSRFHFLNFCYNDDGYP